MLDVLDMMSPQGQGMDPMMMGVAPQGPLMPDQMMMQGPSLGGDQMLPEDPLAIDDTLMNLPPPPTIDYIMTLARDEEDYWRPQKERMALDDTLYQLEDSTQMVHADEGTEEEAEYAALNDLRTIADKFMNRIGRSEMQLQVPKRTEGEDADAQAIEDYLRWCWRKFAQDHLLRGGKMPLGRQEAGDACVRGWLCYRVWYDPEDTEFPFMLDLMDGQFVYPRFNRKGLKHVLYIRDTTVDRLLEDFPEFEPEVRSLYADANGYVDPKHMASYVAYYDRDYHAVVVDNRWVKQPTPHGMGQVPWVCIPNQGGLHEGRYGEGTSNNWTKYYGDSIYAPLRDPYAMMIRLYSALMTQVAKDADPPVVIKTSAKMDREDVDFGVGGTTILRDENGEVKVVEVAQRPYILEPLVSGVKASMAKGSIPDIEWGHDMTAQSGYARTVLSSAADDVFSPPVTAIEIGRGAVSKLILEIIAKNQMTVPMVVTKRGMRMAGQQFSYESVLKNGTYVETRFSQLTPQDMVAMSTLILNLVKGGIISAETARSDKFLALENPTLEVERLLREKALFDPRIMEMLMDFAMMQDPNDPIAVAWQQKKYEEKMMTMMQASQAGGRQLAGRTKNPQPQAGGPQAVGQNVNPDLLMAQREMGGYNG